MRTLSKILLTAALGSFLLVSNSAVADQPTTKTAAKAAPAAAPTAQEITDATAKGLVWVNTNTKVYHKDGQFYGKTKQGKFMTEADAQKAGYRAAQEPKSKKTTAPDTKKK
jgi:hypothetical protein